MDYLDLRVTKAELAREFKISRRTNHHWIETGQLDRELAAGRTQYAPRSRPTHKVDRYRWIIGARLAEFPRLSLQRLFGEVRAAGLRGELRTGTGPRAERASATAGGGAVRFETPPGVGRAGWTSGHSRCRGAGDVRCWWCWVIRDRSCPAFVDTMRVTRKEEATMPNRHRPYAAEFRQQMVELVRSGRGLSSWRRSTSRRRAPSETGWRNGSETLDIARTG